MEDLNPDLVSDPLGPIPSMWDDMLKHLLRDPDPDPDPEAEAVDDRLVQLEDGGLLGLVDSYFGDITGLGEDPNSEAWWAAAPADPVSDQIDLCDSCIGEETFSLPGLSSEISSPASSFRILEEGRDVVDVLDVGVSSPVSCNKAKDCPPSSNSGDEVGNGPSRVRIPVVSSCSDHGAGSPDAGCDSSDVGASGRSCDNFADQSRRLSDDNFAEQSKRPRDMTPTEISEDAKRLNRLMRNRESAVQSRLRKKSYVKELEAKCRAMENQMSILHQTVAFTSAQNAALREELAHYRSLKGNGSKSGVMEPAALPSDSLPSESPSHHTILFPSVRLELVAFLCHVLLLTLLQVLPRKLATSERKPPSKVRSERGPSLVSANQSEFVSEAVSRLWNRPCSSSRRRNRNVSTRHSLLRRPPNRSIVSTTPKPGHHIAENSSSSKRRFSSKRRLKSLRR